MFLCSRFTVVTVARVPPPLVSRLSGLGLPVPLIVILPPSRLLDSSTSLDRPLRCLGFGFSPC